MELDSSLFLAVAQIAGIFVGFGGIIGSLGDFHAKTDAAKLIQSVVSMSISAMTAALIPVTLMQFPLDQQLLWQISSALYIVLIWFGGSLVVFFNAEYRDWFRAHVKRAPLFAALFWIGLEVPIQIALIMALFAVVPEWSQGFYVTALMFNLSQAAILLTRFLFDRPKAE